MTAIIYNFCILIEETYGHLFAQLLEKSENKFAEIY